MNDAIEGLAASHGIHELIADLRQCQESLKQALLDHILRAGGESTALGLLRTYKRRIEVIQYTIDILTWVYQGTYHERRKSICE